MAVGRRIKSVYHIFFVLNLIYLFLKNSNHTNMRLTSMLAAMAAATLFLVSCKSDSKSKSNKPDVLALDIDSTVSPGEDFFLYANGGWIKKNPIPGSESAWGVGYMVQEDIYDRLKKINEDAAAKNPAAGSIEQKIADFWKSGMDSAGREKQGLSSLQDQLNEINAIKSINDLVSVAASFHKKGMNVMFRDRVNQDDKNSMAMVYQLSQGGLGMPNRDYYFNTDQRTAGVRKGYMDYLIKTFKQLGNDEAVATKNAKSVFDLETRLAKSSRTRTALRDPEKNYNKMDLGKLNSISGNINWPDYLKKIGINKLDSVIVGQPEFYAALNDEIKKTPLDVWKNYLQFHLIRASSEYLDTTTYNNYFEYEKLLTESSEPRLRWKRVLDAEGDAMAEALGQLFVKEYFTEKAKKRYSDMVEAVREALKERIQKLSWMSDSTKQKAYEKLARITKKVGYPDKWKDFSSMVIDKGPFIKNVLSAREWWHNYNINKLGKPVDRTEWVMPPQEYNAYYEPSNNEIVLPAGIFAVPGMMDEDLDDAFVYGYAAASTIGHEITHGFDDQGRQYDASGNLKSWWAPKDSAEFVKRAKMIIRQFNEFNPVDTLHINGDATQGENIADLGGLLLGLDAFKKTDAFKKNEKISGLTPLQRYFLGYAYGWLYQTKKAPLARAVMTDVHSPAKERVNGPVVNIPEFYEAFNIKPGDKMYRPDSLRVSIW
jgi:putative endopeptidase